MSLEHEAATATIEAAADAVAPATPAADEPVEHAATLVSRERTDDSSKAAKVEELRRYLADKDKERRAG